MSYQVMCKCGSTYPDTSATDVPTPVGPLHPSRAAAEAYMEAEYLRNTSNREYYEEYTIVEVESGEPAPSDPGGE